MIENAAAPAEHGGGNFNHFVGQVGYALFQHVQDLRSVLLKIGEDGLAIVGRPKVGLERWVIGRCSERQVQFSSAAAESGGSVEINAEMVASQLRDRMLRHFD